MKKLIFFISLFICFITYSQDTIHVYPENAMIKITRLESNPVYINPNTACIRLVRDNIKIYDGSLKVEYDLTTYDKIFNIDTIGFASKNAVLSYLSGFISKVNKPINNKYVFYKSDTAITDSAIWIPTSIDKYFVINNINISACDTFDAILKIYSGNGDTVFNQLLKMTNIYNYNNQINLEWQSGLAGDSIFINTSDTLHLNLILSGYEY